jgi:PKD repeat protein
MKSTYKPFSCTLALLTLVLLSSQFGWAQIGFKENKGQWAAPVRYQLPLAHGTLFAEANQMTICLVDTSIIRLAHQRQTLPNTIPAHAYRVRLVGGQSSTITPVAPIAGTENYFIGNDQRKWATGVRSFGQLRYPNLYPNIDLHLYAQSRSVKYDFILAPGADPNQIRLEYQGIDQLYLQNERLYLKTSISTIEEHIPRAYQQVLGQEIDVPCQYQLIDAQTIGFRFPNGYDSRYPVVIDPVLVFSTYTGSTADNWGFTATYDRAGNLYAGGLVNGIGYPTSVGAFQAFYAGSGNIPSTDTTSLFYNSDIGIIKYSPDGTTRLYATYIGGANNEQPHSLIADNQGRLYILGTTRSPNFPVTATAADTTFNGAIDIVGICLNADGTTLLGSTYIGGSADDGVNMKDGPLYKIYADDGRGEIILSADEQDCYIISSSRSVDFPTTSGVIQPSWASQSQSAVVFKISRDMSRLHWATYFGQTGLTAGYGIRQDKRGDLYIVGGTNSNTLPTTTGTTQPAASGNIDGYLFHLKGDGRSILSGTYVGTSRYDQAFFVDLDAQDNVYIAGQTEGNYPIVNAKYNVANGSQFITSYNPSLTTRRFSTRFGSGRTTVDISLTAFMVDRCLNLYTAGWGSTRQSNTGNSSGLPITADAYRSTSDGSDFHLMCLAPNADSLKYGTFYGTLSNREMDHVDGGTCRFDKNGIIYHSVCASCSGMSDFPTTAGAWSRTNNSSRCNNAAFKFNFQILREIRANFVANNVAPQCSKDSVAFENRSTGADTYLWDLGDNQTSTLISPKHLYASPGRYNVRLIVRDTNLCGGTDTITREILVVWPQVANVARVIASPCSTTVQFVNSPNVGVLHEWRMGEGTTYSEALPQPHTYLSPGRFQVQYVVNRGTTCADSMTQTVEVGNRPRARFQIRQETCSPTISVINTSVQTEGTLRWEFGDGIRSSDQQPAPHTYARTGRYDVRLIVGIGSLCPDTMMQTVFVEQPSIGGRVIPSSTICRGREAAGLNLTEQIGRVIRWEMQPQGTTQWLPINHTQTQYFPGFIEQPRCFRAIVQRDICPEIASEPACISFFPSPVNGIVRGGGLHCEQANGVPLTLSGHNGQVERWESSTDGFQTVQTIANRNDTYTTGTIRQTTCFRAMVSRMGCDPIPSDTTCVGVARRPNPGTVSIGSVRTCMSNFDFRLSVAGNTTHVTGWEFSINNFRTSQIIAPDTRNNSSITLLPGQITLVEGNSNCFRAVVSTPACSLVRSEPTCIFGVPETQGGQVSGLAAVCVGRSPGTLTLSQHVGQVLQWQSSTDGGTNWQSISNTTTTYNPGVLTTNTCFRAKVVNVPCFQQFSAPHCVRVDNPPPSGQITPNQRLCVGETPLPITLTNTTGTIERWQRSTNSGTSWEDIVGNGTTLVPTADWGTACYRALLSAGACQGIQSPSSCIERLPPAQGQYNAPPNAVCSGSNVMLQLSNVRGQIVRWESRLHTATTWNTIQHTGASLGTGVLTQKTCFRAILLQGTCPELAMPEHCIQVDQPVVPGQVIGPDSVCAGQLPGTLLLANSVGIVRHWEMRTANSQAWVVLANGSAGLNPQALGQATCFRAIVENGSCPALPSQEKCIYSKGANPGGLAADLSLCGEQGTTIELQNSSGQVVRWEKTQNCLVPDWQTINHTTKRYFTGLLSQTTCFRAVVTDGVCGTIATPAIKIEVGKQIEVLVNHNISVRCSGGQNGALGIDVIGGLPPYVYQWSGPNGFRAATEDLTLLRAGSYSLTVTDRIGCRSFFNFTVTEPAPLTVRLQAQTQIRCAGMTNGSIGIDVSGGTPGYRYAWASDFRGYTTEDLNNVPAGIYSLTVTDRFNCRTTFQTSLAAPAPVSLTKNILFNPNCNYDVVIAPQGGTAPYTLQTSAGTFAVNSPNYRFGPHLYNQAVTFILRDQNGCQLMDSVRMTHPPMGITRNAIKNVSCAGRNDGSIQINVFGGQTDYSYHWIEQLSQKNYNTEDLLNIPPGEYALTATDAKGCTIHDRFTIQGPTAPLLVSIAIDSPIRCAGNTNGILVAVPSGGTAPYRYEWSDKGAPVATRTGLDARLYTLTVTDANGCIAFARIDLASPTPLQVLGTRIERPRCAGDENGLIDVNVQGGVQPYRFQWNDRLRTTSHLLSAASGTYQLEIIDANGCQLQQHWTIPATAPIAIVPLRQWHSSCDQASDGGAEVIAFGGTGMLRYFWPSNGVFGLINTALKGGSHIVEITDQNQCTARFAVVVPSHPPLAIVPLRVQGPLCADEQNGFIYVQPSGGLAPYRFQWLKDGFFFSTQQHITDLSAGSYELRLSDKNGCTAVRTFVLTLPAPLSASSQTHPSRCADSRDGWAKVEVSGGTPPYEYHWPGGSRAFERSDLGIGDYAVRVVDFQGCQLLLPITITGPTALAMQVLPQNVSCKTFKDGAISIQLTGGTSPYRYEWSDGPQTPNRTGLAEGSYRLTVTDAKGCTIVSDSIFIDEPDQPLTIERLVGIPPRCHGQSNGAIILDVQGGTPAYAYRWEHGATHEDLTDLTSGDYRITITDAMGCSLSRSITITSPAAIRWGRTLINPPTCWGGSDGQITVNAEGGTGGLGYRWSIPGSLNGPSQRQLSAGRYTIWAYDALGCYIQRAIDLPNPEPLQVTGIVQHAGCNGLGSITTTMLSGTAPYRYQWSNRSISPSLTGLSAGKYTQTVTDAKGCTTQQIWEVAGSAPVRVQQVRIVPAGCNNEPVGGVQLDLTGGKAPLQFTWDTRSQSEDLSGVPAGRYTLTVRDDLGCVSSFTYEVPKLPKLNARTGLVRGTSCKGRSDGAVSLIVSGGTPPYRYRWSHGSVFPHQTALRAGFYTVSISDSRGCQALLSVRIPEGTCRESAAPAMNPTLSATIYPNPFASQLVLELQLEAAATVEAELVNGVGQVVQVAIAPTPLGEGLHSLPIDAQSLPHGIYWCSIRINGAFWRAIPVMKAGE